MFKKLYVLFLILSGAFTLTFGMIFASYVVTAGTLTANDGGYFQIYQKVHTYFWNLIVRFFNNIALGQQNIKNIRLMGVFYIMESVGRR